MPSTTSVPSPASWRGEIKPSPHGRLPKAPGAERSPSSEIAVRPARTSRRSLPFGQVIRTSSASERIFATARPRRLSSAMSASITRPRMSSVTCGSVPIRAPASHASRRAAVCERDCAVGHRTTSAAFIAAAIAAGGSVPCVARSAIIASRASAPARPAAPRSRSPRPSVDGLQTTRTCSPSRTAKHSSTTVVIARSRSLMP